MQDWLTSRVQASPDKIALVSGQRCWTYRELNTHVEASGVYLASIKRIGLLLDSTLESVALIFAALRQNVLIVPINTRLTPDEIKWQLLNTHCSFLIASSSLVDKLPYPPAKSDDNFATYYLPKVDKDFKHKPHSLDDNSTPTLNTPFAIVHTSGTSGQSKGAVLTYGNVFYSAMASAYRIGHLPDDKWLCVLPLYHVGGLSILIRAVLYGITVDLRSRFDVKDINHAMTHDNITLVSLVPTMLFRLLESRTAAWSPKLRLVLLGGAAASPELMAQCIAEDIPVTTTYGMSEAASQIATTLPGDAVRKPGTVGKPLMFTQIRVVDEQDNDVPTGEYGEIIVKGQTVMHGYYNNLEASKQALRGGWLHTGDIGYLDDDGDLFLVQRRSDLIVSGGENVYPAEVEAVLRQHPAIKAVAVVGIPDAEWGQKVAAAIVLRPDQSLTEDEVEQYTREHLAGYKIPRIVKFVDELPQTSSGKIQRSGVKDFFINHKDAEDTKK